MSFEVDVQRASESRLLPRDGQLCEWAIQVLSRHRESAALSVRLVGEEEGCRLNRDYRCGDGATNVLSFPFDAPECTDPPLLGDVVICAVVVEREASAQGKSVSAHYAHMVVHGVLHLLGHDHEEEGEARRMEDLEREHMRALGFDNPYPGESDE